MKENSILLASPCALGAISGCGGFCAGYVFAPRKYTLEDLLSQSEDSFNKNFSSEVMKNASEKEMASLENLRKASKIYNASGNEILINEIKPAAKQWHKLVSEVNVEDKFVSRAEATKSQYVEAVNKSKYKELNLALQNARQKALVNSADVNLNKEVRVAAYNFAEAQVTMEPYVRAYRDARDTFRSARKSAIAKLPDEGREIAIQWEKVSNGLTKRAKLMNEKLAELSLNSALQKDFSKIKKYIPKARAYSSMLCAGIAGTIGTIYGLCVLTKVKNAS